MKTPLRFIPSDSQRDRFITLPQYPALHWLKQLRRAVMWKTI